VGVLFFPCQDAIKKTSRDELPDFYNIVLERPKDDPAGYDVLFIDAASKVNASAGTGWPIPSVGQRSQGFLARK
jgi:hypothetical protein